MEVRFLLVVNNVELLNWKVELKGSLVFVKEVRIGGFVLFVNVINVYIFDLIFLLKRVIIELNMYFWEVVRCVFGVFIIK